MVTFSLPGDSDVAEPTATPRSRPPLPFAKRTYAASPYNSAPRRLGASQGASARKSLTTRDDVPASSLNRSFAAASNIFRASAISDSPPPTSFSPSLSQTPMKKVFAPGATPEPSRVQRESVAHATPRGVAARAKEKDLFPMRIASPPRELTGEALTQKVPKDWDPKGSIYADQFLGHLSPPDLDDEQRRQFFCILDLRRLKYAADEIFTKKSWKLNVLNFAKEFEKSRSIILLHYGLYEFQNVKPSKELIRRWRREHGLPPLDDDEPEATPSKPVSTKKKRKAADDGREEPQSVVGKGKRRATEKEDGGETDASAPTFAPTPTPAAAPAPAPAAPPAPTSVLGKNKRRVSDSEDADSQPSKMQKQPSSTRSLFEKAANKASTTPAATPAKTNLFASGKPAGGESLFQSVLKNNAKSDATQKTGNDNIFGHLSDTSAGKNSGQEADGESETDSEPEEVAANGAEEEPKAKTPALPSTAGTGTTSDAGTRESTPGRSLFERVAKTSGGEPARAGQQTEPPAAPKDQTWNPSATPIKFAPTAGATGATSQASSLFGNSGATSAASLFGQKAPPPTSNLFGAPKQDGPAGKETNGKAVDEAGDDAGESDKENDSHGPNKSLPEPKPAQPQPSFGSSLFQAKPAPAEAAKEAEVSKPAAPSDLFGAAAAKPAEATNVLSKPAEPSSTPAAPVMQSSTLFGAKPSEPEKAAPSEPEKPAPAFGAAPSLTPSASASSLFGAKPDAPSGSLFGNSTSSAPAKSIFGNSSSTEAAAPATTAPAPATSTPTFSFSGATNSAPTQNGTSEEAAKKPPVFGAPKSPPNSTGAGSMFDGSPMKQDDKPAAKLIFGGANGVNGTNGTSSTPTFSFGPSASTGTTGGIFGGPSNPPASNGSGGGNIFGGATGGSTATTGGGGFNFNFTGGGNSQAGNPINNPFSSGGKAAESSGPTSGGMFNFGGASGAQPNGNMFQFGSSNAGSSAPSSGPFGGSQPNGNGAPAFGGSPAPPSGPVFSFGGAPSQPQGQNSAPAFLQPPSGGPSTGTNTPSNLGGGSSLATTPAYGTPEPSSNAEGAKGGDDEEGEKHEQINLADKLEEDEDVLHEVRAKVLKFRPAGKAEGDDKPKSKSPWSTQGVGPLRLLKHKETSLVRLLLRAEPRGNVAINRALLPDLDYKADEKYVKVTTSNDAGDGLETWMIQVKTKESAAALAAAMEEHKAANKK